MTAPPSDGWKAGQTYEQFMGRWSRPLATDFVRWLAPIPHWHWLDVGTGTGALASAIVRLAEPASVTACDPSEPFIDSAREQLRDDRVRFVLAGSGNLPSRDEAYDAVVSGLALNFFPNPLAAVEEQLTLLRSGGTVAAFVWDYAEGMEFLRCFWDVATSVSSEAAAFDEGARFPICDPERLERLFSDAGAREIRRTSLVVPTVFESFEDYWQPFLGGTGPAPRFLEALSAGERRAVEAELRNRLPLVSGAISLTARAWAVSGRAS